MGVPCVKKRADIVIVLLLLSAVFAATNAHAIHPPPARILDARTSPECVTVVPAFWLNKTLSKYTGGEGPAVAVKNTCEKAIVITGVSVSAAPDVEKAAVPQLGLALHSDESGYHGAFLVADGEDCASPLAVIREANKTQCKNIMVAMGDTLTMPMKWGNGFTVSGFEAGAEDKKISIEGVLVDPLNPFASLGWLAAAAERGDRESQLELGMLYLKPGDKQDETTAAKWLLKAAEQGAVMAQYKIALAYDTGAGVAQDFAEAAKWYEKSGSAPANKAGDGLSVIESKCRLGAMYAEGIGVKQDHGQMAKWWEISAPKLLSLKEKAEGGDGEAQLALGNLLRPSMSCRRQANAEAAKWYRMAAEQGVTDAEYYIGRLYDAGEGLARSDKEALKWYGRAVAKGHPQAQYQLGLLFARPFDGYKADAAKSLKWIMLAAQQGHTLAAYHLAHLYATGGKGVAKDDAEAYFWYSVPMKYQDRLETRPGMNDVGVWRLSVLDPYESQREKAKAKLSVEQQQVVKQRLIEWQPKTPEQSSAVLEQ